jgi:hypothetical protein
MAWVSRHPLCHRVGSRTDRPEPTPVFSYAAFRAYKSIFFPPIVANALRI